MGCGPRQSTYRNPTRNRGTTLMNELRSDVALEQEALLSKLETARDTFAVKVCELATGEPRGLRCAGAR